MAPLDRIIPAWAGNTPHESRNRQLGTDHPRVGGEHSTGSNAASTWGGSSPRGRGTLYSCSSSIETLRIIPAWAGNTSAGGLVMLYPPDHPRVGGEHSCAGYTQFGCPGSSPRGRGTPRGAHADRFHSRIIPAWAGNTPAVRSRVQPGSDHPRVGGEHPAFCIRRSSQVGSSPRGRGTPFNSTRIQYILRIIPAWAGNTNPGPGVGVGVTDHPRVGGEHLAKAIKRAQWIGSSPRGRGTRNHDRVASGKHRIIPAWAGNTMT